MTDLTEFNGLFKLPAGPHGFTILADQIDDDMTDIDLYDLYRICMKSAAGKISPLSRDKHQPAYFVAWARRVIASREATKRKAGRPKKNSAAKLAQVIELKRQGLKWADIVEQTGVPMTTAKKHWAAEIKDEKGGK